MPRKLSGVDRSSVGSSAGSASPRTPLSPAQDSASSGGSPSSYAASSRTPLRSPFSDDQYPASDSQPGSAISSVKAGSSNYGSAHVSPSDGSSRTPTSTAGSFVSGSSSISKHTSSSGKRQRAGKGKSNVLNLRGERFVDRSEGSSSSTGLTSGKSDGSVGSPMSTPFFSSSGSVEERTRAQEAVRIISLCKLNGAKSQRCGN